MNQIVFSSCVILLMSITVYASNYEALIFDRIDRTFFHLPMKPSEKKCGNWASACSADSSEDADKKFIDQYSITKKPLFVADTYKAGDSISKVAQNICAKPFEISLAFNIDYLSFEFGFEVYYTADKISKYFNSNTANYKTAARATEMMRKIFGADLLLSLEIFERIKMAFTDEGGTKWYKGTKMNLVWIPMFRVEYNFSSMILAKITYEIRRSNTWPVVTECQTKDYVLGNETYQNYKNIGDVNVDKLYQNQAEIFKDLKCPPGESCPMGETSCNANNHCLKKWSLIPIDQFHLYPTLPLLCSNITTVPIWRTMVEGLLKKLDQFLYALFRHLDNPIYVLAGTIRNLKFPKNSRISISNQTIYLDLKNSLMPVPDLIYKLVKYILPNCNPWVNICEYSAIIFIHNNPNFDSTKKMCKGAEDMVATGGWGTIMTDPEGEVYKNIYVCKNTQELLNKMFGWFSLSLIKPRPTGGTLDLNRFPYLDGNGNLDFDDIEGKVINRFNELAHGKDESEFDELIAVAQTNVNEVDDEPNFKVEKEVAQSSSQQLK